MASRDDKEYLWLTKEVIADIERQLNPGSLAFHPPKSWSCPQLDMALKKAYKSKFPQAVYEPQYKGRAQLIATEELNQILHERLKVSVGNPIDSWRETKPADEPFSSVAIAGPLNALGVGRSPPTSYKKRNSPPATTLPTLPSQSQYTVASSSTSVSTGRGTCTTLNGNNGEPLPRQRNVNSPGPSPARGAVSNNGGFRSRRGRGGHRPGQPRGSGVHVCNFDGCGKSFQYPSKLKDHEHTHLPAKDFACRLGSCTKSFKRLRELKAHEKITHPGHPSESEAGHPSGSEAGDHEMTDAGEVEHVEDQTKMAGRRVEDNEVGIEVTHKRKSPPLELHRPSNKISEVEKTPSSPSTPNDRGTASPEPKRRASPGPKRRAFQPPVCLPPPDPNLTLPIMPEEPRPKSKSPSPSSESSSPGVVDDARAKAHIQRLAVNLLTSSS